MNKRVCLSSTQEERGNSSIPRPPPFTPKRQTQDHHTSLQLVYVDRNHSYKYEGRKVSPTEQNRQPPYPPLFPQRRKYKPISRGEQSKEIHTRLGKEKKTKKKEE